MACRRCGCLMLTKVGRTTPMLICTDCGLPVDQRETAELKRKRFWGAVTLVTMASMGGLLLLMVSMSEMRTTDRLQLTSDGEKEKKEGDGSESAFHSDGLVDDGFGESGVSGILSGGDARKPGAPIQGPKPGSPGAAHH